MPPSLSLSLPPLCLPSTKAQKRWGKIVNGYDGVQRLLGSPAHPFHRQYKIYYRLAGGPPQLTHCFKGLGMGQGQPRRLLLGPEIFSPVPWWRGQSSEVAASQVRETFPDAIATHYGYSTNNPIVVEAEEL